jgi:hypothetical protein
MKRLTKPFAFTVPELMIAAAVGSLALVAAVSAALSMQRCIVAGEEFAADKSEQTRLSDYLALDLRRAISIQGAVPADNVLLTVTLPNYYDADGNPRTPTIIKTADMTYLAQYDPNPVTIVYRKVNSIITRTEGAGEAVVIANNVEDFECPIDPIGTEKVARTKVTFLPSFQRNGTVSAATRAATTVYSTVRLRNYKPPVAP